MLRYEAAGLTALHGAAKMIKVPKARYVGELPSGGAFIAMDFIPFGARGSKSQYELGEGIAEIHRAPSPYQFFGFPMDGCCGSCPQLNNSSQEQINWVQFWRKYRLGSQLEMLKENAPSDVVVQEKGLQLLNNLEELFSDLIVEDIVPSLLHGDLWSGNVAVDEKGNFVIFDPAAYYGHSEADLGIARMFGGFGGQFWEGYHSVIPKSKKYNERALLYELHHHLNHYNIFGSSYRSGALSLISKLLSSLH
uniref:protein-ribulosamine 3-kinase n=1 Tax=Arcella intermedia TaxID=1963864 RepID=A0A6B2LEH5_9EUKA